MMDTHDDENKNEEEEEEAVEEDKRNCCMNCLTKVWQVKEDRDGSETDQENFVKQTFKELLIYIVFIIFVCIISFMMASTNMYYYTKVMMDLFIETGSDSNDATQSFKHPKFRDIKTMEQFWDYIADDQALMSGLYWKQWYNNEEHTEGFIYYENKLLGPPRIRQIRVNKGSCIITEEFSTYFENCFGEYDEDYEDKKPLKRMETNSTTAASVSTAQAWQYKSQEELKGYLVYGQLHTYNGGGYAIDLATVRVQSQAIIKDLHDQRWLRRGSRAVFIHFTVYNANINLFCVITLYVEFPATGGAIPGWNFETVKLLRYVSTQDKIIFFCEIIFLLFILYYLVEEIIEITLTGFEYFFDFWNLLDILLIVVSIMCSAMNIYRYIQVAEKLEYLKNNKEKYQNFEYLGFLESFFNNVVAIMVFLAWVKVFKYISFNKTMTQLSTTLNRCAKDLLGFLVMFTIVFVAFTSLGFLMFCTQVKDFNSMLSSFFTLFRIILGDFDFQQLKTAHRFFGPAFFMGFVFFVFFVLINMFLAIINDTYSEVKSDMAKQVDVFIMSDYLKQSFDRFRDKLVSTKEKMEVFEKILHTEGQSKRLGYEEFKNELLKQGYDEEEIETVFTKYDVDGDRALDPEEQRKMLDELEKQKGLLKTKEQRLDGNVTAFTDHDAEEDSDEEHQHDHVDPALMDEFISVEKKVMRMENTLGTILANLDVILATIKS